METAENEKGEIVLRIIPASAKGLVEEWLHEILRLMESGKKRCIDSSGWLQGTYSDVAQIVCPWGLRYL